jgi:hypothetical protein
MRGCCGLRIQMLLGNAVQYRVFWSWNRDAASECCRSEGVVDLELQMLLENAVDERVMQNCKQNLPENAVDAKGIEFAQKTCNTEAAGGYCKKGLRLALQKRLENAVRRLRKKGAAGRVELRCLSSKIFSEARRTVPETQKGTNKYVQQ